GLALDDGCAVAGRMVFRGSDDLGGLDRHVPGVDDIGMVVAVILGQAGGPDYWLVLTEIDDRGVAVPRTRHPIPWVAGRRIDGLEAVLDIFLHHVAEEADALPGFAVQLAALGPPEQIVGIGEGFAVAGIAAAHGGNP